MAPTKAKSRSRPKQAWCDYLFKIEQAHAHYSFSAGMKFDDARYGEHLHPTLYATCVAPAKLAERRTTFTLIGNRAIEEELRSQDYEADKANLVGTLTMRGDLSEYLGAVPFSVAWEVVPSVQSGAFKFIYLHGAVLSRGSASIRSIGFYTEFDTDNI